MRYCITTLTAIALVLCGCAGDQARAAANISVLANAIAKSGDLNSDQALLLQGILCEADAIRESTEPTAQPTIDTSAPPATMAAQAQEHAGTVHSVAYQVATNVWTWALGAAGIAATALLGGGGGLLVARRGAQGVLQTVIRYGSAAMERLKDADPEAAQQVLREQKALQNAAGYREEIRLALERVKTLTETIPAPAPVPVPVPEVSDAQTT